MNINEQITLLQDEIYSFEEKLKELPVLIIANKSDLNKVEDSLINISALEGSNLDILLRKIVVTGFLKLPFRHSFQTGIKIQL